MKANTRLFRSVLSLLCLAGIVLSLLPAAGAQASPPPASAAPVPVQGEPPVADNTPNLAKEMASLMATVPPVQQTEAPAAVILPPVLNPPAGYAGQEIQVLGQATTGIPGLRIFWDYEGATRPVTVVPVSPLSQYEGQAIVPFDAPPGPARVCVADTGDEQAELVCTVFTVQAAPPGAVTYVPPEGLAVGGEPLPAFLLLDRAGEPIAQQQISPDQPIYIANVPVGIYQPALVGVLGVPIALSEIVVMPGITVTATATAPSPFSVDPLTGKECETKIRVAQAGMTPSTKSATLEELDRAGLTEFPDLDLSGPNYDFGVYLVGVALNGQLTVRTQSDSGVQEGGVHYVFSQNDKKIEGILSGGSHTFQGAVALGDARFTSGAWKLSLYPRDNNAKEYCPTTKTVLFMDDPMKSSFLRQEGGQSVSTWNSERGLYEFKGVLPNFLGLPLQYPKPPDRLPILGELDNKLDAGLFMEGTIGLDHTMTFMAVDASAYAMAFSMKLAEKKLSIDPKWGHISFNPSDLRTLAFTTKDIELASVNWKTKLYEGVLASYWGIVSIKASVSIGLKGEVVLKATVRPLAPAVDITVTPSVSPWLAVSIWVDLLLGLASAGADATATAGVSLPIHMNTDRGKLKDWVYIDTPCVGVKVLLNVWARINLVFYEKKWNLAQTTLLDYLSSGCKSMPKPLPPAPAPPKPPALLSIPVLAASINGDIAEAYVYNDSTNPAVVVPRVKVLIRRFGSTSPFPETYFLTDGKHMVQDPAITFAAGPRDSIDGKTRLIVAWTETMMTADEERAAGDDMNKFLQRQEIMSAWSDNTGKQWTTTRVTNDLVPDGRPVLAGENGDGATLAWVRSGGEKYDRNKTLIVTRDWDYLKYPNSLRWDFETRFDTPGMDAQPTLARHRVQRGSGGYYNYGKRVLAFVKNGDGDMTGSPRRIAAYSTDGSDVENPEYNELNTLDFLNGAMQPSIVIEDNGGIGIAFVVGPASATNTPTNQLNELYLAHWDWKGQVLSVNPILDSSLGCQPTYAEKPTLLLDWWKEAPVLAFRYFGRANTNEAGGMAKLQYLTDWKAPCEKISSVSVADGNNMPWMVIAVQNKRDHSIEIRYTDRISRSSTDYAAAIASLPSGSTAALPFAIRQKQDDSEWPVEAVTLPYTPDPSLDTALLFDPPYAAVGAPVIITATMRNLGLAANGKVTVELFRGEPGLGVSVGKQDVTAPLTFGEAIEVAFPIAASGIAEPYYAVLTAEPDGDIGRANNEADGMLNQLDQPVIQGIIEAANFADSAHLTWADEANPAVAGYRILRATSLDGPYELVGVTQSPSYSDLDLEANVLYYYKVQSFDQQGAVSEYSEPVGAQLAGDAVYLPTVYR